MVSAARTGHSATEFDPVFLSRLHFGFVISFHIIFPSFTIGHAARFVTIDGMRLATGDAIYRWVFEKVYALSFGMGRGRRHRLPTSPRDNMP